MWVMISFSGILSHLEIIKQERKILLMTKESIESSIITGNSDLITMTEALNLIDRLLKSADRKSLFLEDLVTDFRKKKQESGSQLDELEWLLNNYLQIEDI